MECNDKIQEMRHQLGKTPEGRAMIRQRLTEAFNSLLPAGKDSLGWEEMKKMADVFSPTHDHMVGGHWNWDDKTAKATFDFMVSIFGQDGRVTLGEWLNSFIPYMRYVIPFVEEKHISPDHMR